MMHYLAAIVLGFSIWTIAVSEKECVEGISGANCPVDYGGCETVQLCNTSSGSCNVSCQNSSTTVDYEQGQSIQPFLILFISAVATITGCVVVMAVFFFISYYGCHRKKETILEIDATSDFHKSEDPTLQLRRLHDDGSTREVRSILDSWGSEFTKEGDRKTYVNVMAYKKLPDQKTTTSAIYANTPPVPDRTYTKSDHCYVNVNQ